MLMNPERYIDRNLPCAEVSQATMSRIRTIFLSLLASALLAGSFGSAQALASHTQTTYFEASNDLLEAKTRPHVIAQMKHLGVHALRVELYWHDVAPSSESATKPSFEATNPQDYNWGEYAEVLAEAKRLGWPVLLTVTSPVPRWATSNGKAPYITRPDPEDFKEFMTAVAREFGSEVSIYAIWNEPNHPAFLLPQWNSNGTPASGRIYRGLYEAGYAGLQAAGIAHPNVLFGETAPTGFDSVKSLLHSKIRKERANALVHDVAPLAFMREALCLNASYKKAGSCSELLMSGYAHHAYTEPAGPFFVTPDRDDVMIGSLSRLSNALNLAGAAHAIPASVPIYLTEFGVQSYPNKQLGVPVAKQAEYDAICERIAWENPRVVAFSQYLLKDDPLGGAPGASAHGGTVGFQTGLEYEGGAPKPLYFGWPIPLTVTKAGHGVALWGFVRPAGAATKVTVLVKARGAKRFRTLATVATNSLGYWTLRSSTPGELWRVRWTSPEHVSYEGPAIRAY
jgi:Cellulase (glycosyl hydrolase family 5)